MIQNPKHVKELRDVFHAAINGWAHSRGIGEQGLEGSDLCTALALVMRDIVWSAPDPISRSLLTRQIVTAIQADTTRPVLIRDGIKAASPTGKAN